MPHKLHITMTVEPIFRENVRPFYKSVLNKTDVVRGVPFKIIVQAKNIGDKKFPGGKQDTIIHYAGGAFTQATPVDMPPIGVDEVQILHEATLVPLSEGSASVELKIKAKDGDQVEGYQHRRDKPVRTNGWVDLFYVINFEHAVMMMQLERLSSLMERRGK